MRRDLHQILLGYATPPTPQTTNPNKRKNAKRPSPNLASLNIRKSLVRSRSNSAIPPLVVTVRVHQRRRPFMSLNVLHPTTSTMSSTMLSTARPSKKTVYESQCTTSYHKHDVVDDVVDCKTIQEEKCEDVTQGYTTEQKCHKW